MYSLSFLPIISKPTRITDNSATLIDDFFINEPCNFESGILISDISDHFPIFFISKKIFCTNCSKNVNKGVHYRLVNQNTLSALDEMLALTNFDDIINNIFVCSTKELLCILGYFVCSTKELRCYLCHFVCSTKELRCSLGYCIFVQLNNCGAILDTLFVQLKKYCTILVTLFVQHKNNYGAILVILCLFN